MKNLVQYTIKPDQVAKNENLVREVYKELHDSKIEGFHYATFKMPDGVTFVHLAFGDNEEAGKKFRDLQAFKNFQSNIKERCETLPAVSAITEIGTYHFIESI